MNKRVLLCWGIAGIALLLSLLYVVETNKDLAFSMPVIDGTVYHRHAIASINGQVSDEKPFWQPPMYQWWMGGVYRMLGANPQKLRYAQCVFPLIVVLLTFSIGVRIGGRGVGLIAGLLTAFSGPLLFYYGQFFPAGLAVALDMFALWLMLRAWKKGRARDWLICGVGIGAASLAVPNVLVLGVLGVGLQLGKRYREKGFRQNDLGQNDGRRGEKSKTLMCAGVFVVGICACILPVTIRNAVVSGQFVPISTNGGINLFIGNNASMVETMAIRPGLDWDRLARGPFEEGSENESQAQSWFVRKTIRYATDNPLGFLKGLGYKAQLLLTGVEVPRNVDIYVFSERSKVLGLLMGWFALPFSVLAALAAVGMLECRRNAYARIVCACLALYAFSVIIFFPSARYRAPLIPMLAIFAGMALLDLGRLLFRKKLIPVLFRVVGICVVMLVVSLPVAVPGSDVDFAAELENALGTALEVRGHRHDAMNHYRRTIVMNEGSYEGHYNLANALRIEGELDKALEHYRKAVDLRPDHDRALANMGITFAQKGQSAEAIKYMEMSIEHDSWNAQTHISLGACYVRAGKAEKGAGYLEKALALEPSNVPALQNLAGAFYLLKRFDESVATGRKALALDPNNASVHNNIGMVLIAMGKEDEGQRHLKQADILKGKARLRSEARTRQDGEDI
ncbi:MAG: tetratricopeptide repeat protein [Kiritimatiellae bacterium]|nr:tetratricopeptide repeat protein [Kiritimatiellia bacterium]